VFRGKFVVLNDCTKKKYIILPVFSSENYKKKRKLNSKYKERNTIFLSRNWKQEINGENQQRLVL
jgi:hypothetical protein